MTEYLKEEQLGAFFAESKKVLNSGGKLITTMISKHGFGFAYVTAARLLRGIHKYNYDKKAVTNKLRAAGFSTIEIISLNSWLHLPWAYLVIAE
jgi:cyclopropane fatty-acyl-phospholipid synthase-like methyltransferase